MDQAARCAGRTPGCGAPAAHRSRRRHRHGWLNQRATRCGSDGVMPPAGRSGSGMDHQLLAAAGRVTGWELPIPPTIDPGRAEQTRTGGRQHWAVSFRSPRSWRPPARARSRKWWVDGRRDGQRGQIGGGVVDRSGVRLRRRRRRDAMADGCRQRQALVLDLVQALTTAVLERDVEATAGMLAPVMTAVRTAAVVADPAGPTPSPPAQ
jgi:hypothetical protein